MADAKIKKFKGNVTKLNYFHQYIVNEYIVLRKFGSHTISDCRVTGEGPPNTPRSWEAKKSMV